MDILIDVNEGPNQSRQVELYGKPLVEQGYTVFSLNHRAIPRFQFPSQLNDVQRAVRFIRFHADTFKIDPNSIGAIGGSSQPDFIISSDQTHNKFSRTIPPAIRVPDGSVIEAFTQEATGGQLDINSTLEDVRNLDFDKIHTLTGPIYIEGAEVGDVLAVGLLEIEPGDWGWTIMDPIRGFLKLENTDPFFKTFALDKKENVIHFTENIDIPIEPFAGVMGVAPNTDSLLNTIPPRANGGNLDDFSGKPSGSG